MKLFVILIAMLPFCLVSAKNTTQSTWEQVHRDKDITIYIDFTSMRLDPEPFSKGVQIWEKVITKKPITTKNMQYNEMIVLYNVDCYRQAIKSDELIFKNKGKVVYRQSQDSWSTPVYTYPEPDSVALGKVKDFCYIWNKITVELGLRNGQEFYDQYIAPYKK